MGDRVMLLATLRKYSLSNGIAVLAAGVLLLAAAPATEVRADTPLTTQQQQQVTALTTQLIQLIQGMPTTSTQADYVSVIVGASVGVSCPIAKLALANVEATPGLPAAAIAAAKQVAASCTGSTVSAVTPPPPSGPDFSPGGGGANYQ
jgi:hypothetical protein